MSLAFAHSPLLLVLALAVAAAFSYWSYHATVPQLTRPKRGVLMALRFLALAIVILLLFEPVLHRLEREAQPPVLAVLLDDSRSLTIGAGGATETPADTSAATARETIRKALGPDLPGEVRFYHFSSDAAPVDASSAVDALDLDGPRTDIARALEHVRDDLQEANLGSVVLVSDGQYNTGRNPLYVADRYPVPIHTVTVGDTLQQRDVLLRRINTNDIAYVGTETPVSVDVRAEGYAGERVRISLHQQGRTLNSRTVDLPDDAASETSVDLVYVPEEPGVRRLSVQVTELPGEATYRNNSSTASVRVLERRRQYLLLAAAPGPDVSAVRQILERDADVSVTTRIQRDAGSFYEGTLPDDLAAYDAVVLAGYPGTAARTAEVQRLAEAVEKGLPMLFLLTPHADLEVLRRHLGGLLPAAPEEIRERLVEAGPVLTSRGRQHPVMEAEALSPERLADLPPLRASETRWRQSPDAHILMTTRVQGVQLDDPLLAVRDRTGHRSAMLLGAGTWRWYNLPEDLGDEAPPWPTLLTNIMDWLATPENDRRVRIEPGRDVFDGGERVEFDGQVYDESLNPVPNASVEVTVTAPDGTRSPYTMEAVGEGRYTLDAGRLPEGSYSYTARATREGALLGEDEGRFAVGGLDIEFRETRADVHLMRQIAARSGGRFRLADAATGLKDEIAEAPTFATTYLEEVSETRLWHLYGFVAVVIGLLAAEWFIRKRSGMV